VSHSPPQPAPSAVQNAERTLAASAAVLRLGALLLLLAAVPALAGNPHPVRAGLVAAAVAAESALFAALCLRTGVLRRSWAALDLLAVALALFWSVWPVTHGGPVESPLFNVALVSAVIAGLPPGPWWATLATVVPVAAATVAPALLSHEPSAPAWTLLPDGTATPSAAFIAWFVARLVRRSARDYDEHRALIVRRAEVLARERERVRQSAALQARLLVTLGDVVAAGAVTEPALANQLDAEVRWLRRVVDVGLVDPPPGLADGMRVAARRAPSSGPSGIAAASWSQS
jgi:hypothetical protein